MPREKWDSVEQYIEYLRHLAAYVFAEKFIAQKTILEIGCGTGYGTNHMSEFALNTIAIDIWKEGVRNCKAKYKKENVFFLCCDGLKLPFRKGSFDVALSFQVIEHIEPYEVHKYLSEANRVLREGGTFVVSTPNSKLTLLPFQKPWYPEHKIEYNCKSLKNLLEKVFKNVKICSLRAPETIESIERNRVRQSPLIVYLVAPFNFLLKKFFPSSSFMRLSRVENVLKFRKVYSQFSNEGLVNKFSVDDFNVDADCAKYCIDVYGICVKA